jgi:ankyrin repeat protein
MVLAPTIVEAAQNAPMATDTDLFAALDAGDDAAVERILASDPAAAAARDPDGVSAVLHALYHGRRAAAEAIAAALPTLDVFDAAGLARADVVAGLVASDPALASAWSADGFTALHYAAFFGDGPAAQALLAADADPDARSRNELWVNPIHSAAAGGRDDVVAALIVAGADVTAQQRHGYTPLHAAAQNGDDAMVTRLLAAGADPRAATDDGKTPADLATEAGHEELAARLR